MQDFSLGKNVSVKIDLMFPLDSNTYILSRFGTQSATLCLGTSTYCGIKVSTRVRALYDIQEEDSL